VNRKQFLILVVALVLLGGAGLALFWQDIAAYRASGARIGAKLLPDFRIAEVAEIRLQDAKNQITLARREGAWRVLERGGYAADLQQISDFMIKLAELKVTQVEQVGAPHLARLELVEPGKGEGAGTLVELRDAAGKPLARLVIGKKVLKKDPLNPLPAAKDGVPAGRYVLAANAQDTVVVVSDPLHAAEAVPGRWLEKDFFKVERVKTLAVGPEGEAPRWKIARAEEWGPWKFAGGEGTLDASAAVSAVNALANLAFKDVVADPRPEQTERPLVALAETFDNLVYTVKLAPVKGGEDYWLNFAIAGEPPKTRVPEKGEKKEEQERRDKEFAESLKRLEERLAREKALAKWTYVVARREVEALLKERADMLARKREERGK
jgi:hypothetical protein